MSQTVEITRYPNRRLYDRNAKRYVTLGDIEEMVRGGRNVVVRDSKSREDLTRVILTQILIERHPERMQMFPVALLHEILRADQMALDWLTVYLGQAKTFMASLPAAETFVPGMDFWQRWMLGAGQHADESTPKESPPPEPEEDLAERMAAMERRLRELESRRE